jgi:hypothetical protein
VNTNQNEDKVKKLPKSVFDQYEHKQEKKKTTPSRQIDRSGDASSSKSSVDRSSSQGRSKFPKSTQENYESDEESSEKKTPKEIVTKPTSGDELSLKKIKLNESQSIEEVEPVKNLIDKFHKNAEDFSQKAITSRRNSSKSVSEGEFENLPKSKDAQKINKSRQESASSSEDDGSAPNILESSINMGTEVIGSTSSEDVSPSGSSINKKNNIKRLVDKYEKQPSVNNNRRSSQESYTSERSNSVTSIVSKGKLDRTMLKNFENNQDQTPPRSPLSNPKVSENNKSKTLQESITTRYNNKKISDKKENDKNINSDKKKPVDRVYKNDESNLSVRLVLPAQDDKLKERTKESKMEMDKDEKKNDIFKSSDHVKVELSVICKEPLKFTVRNTETGKNIPFETKHYPNNLQNCSFSYNSIVDFTIGIKNKDKIPLKDLNKVKAQLNSKLLNSKLIYYIK